jgi:hypothetical protein
MAGGVAQGKVDVYVVVDQIRKGQGDASKQTRQVERAGHLYGEDGDYARKKIPALLAGQNGFFGLRRKPFPGQAQLGRGSRDVKIYGKWLVKVMAFAILSQQPEGQTLIVRVNVQQPAAQSTQVGHGTPP